MFALQTKSLQWGRVSNISLPTEVQLAGPVGAWLAGCQLLVQRVILSLLRADVSFLAALLHSPVV